MINSSIYNYIDVLDMAADAASKRQEILSNNLANVSVPHYKRKDIAFEGILQSAMYGNHSLDSKVQYLNDNREEFQPMIYTDNSSLSYKEDENNVDANTEEAYIAENKIRYDALVDMMNQEFSRLQTVLQK